MKTTLAALTTLALAASATLAAPEPTTVATETVICYPAVSADIDGDKLINSNDFFLFINVWMSGSEKADVNHDMTVNSSDFFDFINAFMAPAAEPSPELATVSAVAE